MLANVPLVSLYVVYLYLKRGDEGVNNYGPPSGKKLYESSKSAVEAYEPATAPDILQTQAIETEELPTTPQVKFCRKCGNKLIEDSVFCSSCGTKVLNVTGR